MLRSIARKYAKALAKSANDLDGALGFLEAFAQLLWNGKGSTGAFWSSFMLLKRHERFELLEEIVSGQEQCVRNFVRIVHANGRLRNVGQILEMFRAEYARVRGRLMVNVKAAGKMTKAASAKLEKKLALYLSSEVMTSYSVDKSLLSGILIRWEGASYDASLKTKLDRLRSWIVPGSL